MSALQFIKSGMYDHWIAMQPDGEPAGQIRRSRRADPNCAYEALLRSDIRRPGGYRSQSGYAPDPEGAMRLLVSAWAFHFGHERFHT